MLKNFPEHGKQDIAGRCDGYLNSVLTGTFVVERVGAKPFTYGTCASRAKTGMVKHFVFRSRNLPALHAQIC
jgi:hypothetical protein